ncbi:MAG TPA: hypothetical protein VGM44_07990, partial [Polyangiaceae bacterium]
MSLSSLRVRRFVRAGIVTLMVYTVACFAPACLDRKVVPSEPASSEILIDQVRQSLVTKIDLLFMVDNSASMADKQQILETAVPVLVKRLVTPICVDPTTRAPVGGNANANGNCASGQPEFRPVQDIHIGIVTSSLGSHGAAHSSCAAAPPSANSDNPVNDSAHLLGTIRGQVADAGIDTDPTAVFPLANTWNNSGFLAWDPGQKDVPTGAKDPDAFAAAFGQMIHATGQVGCGYEAQLESWYRFLIDPEPPVNVTENSDQKTV